MNTYRGGRWCLAVALFCALAPSRSAALNINIELQDHGNNPAFDPDGTRLRDYFNVAANYWERLIIGGTTHTVDVSWDPLGGSLGFWEPTINPFGDNDIRIEPNLNWFLDPTPYGNEEFDFSNGANFSEQGQSFYRDLTPAERNDWFSEDNPPDLLEVGYRGEALLGSDASGKYDLLSTIIHELGHDLGINGNRTFSGDFSLLGVPGDVDAVDDDGHLAARYSLMCESCGATSLRRLPSALDVLVVGYEEFRRKVAFNIPGPVIIDLERKHFFSGNNWNAAAGWIGFAVPDAFDDASILAGQFATLSAPGTAGTLTVAEGSIVTTSNQRLRIVNGTYIRGVGSTIQVEPGGELDSNLIEIESSATLSMFSGGLLDTNNLKIGSGTGLYGLTGTHTIDVLTSLVNDGVIFASGGSTMRFTTSGFAPWDLDGANEAGVVDASAGNIEFLSGILADPFAGTVKIGAGHYVYVNNVPWILEGSGRLELNGGGTVANRAWFTGGEFYASSSGSSVLATGVAAFDSPFTNIAGTVTVAAGGTLDMNAHATIEGGAFVVGQGGSLNFNSTVTLFGNPSFSTFNTSVSNGDIEFNGPTNYAGGTITTLGIVRQDGNVTMTAATTVNASGVFDMDGSNPTPTTWTINRALTINADYVEILSFLPFVNPNNVVDATISIDNSGGITVFNSTSGALAVNLSANKVWRMAGTMNLNGSTPFPVFNQIPTMVSGSPMYMTGTLNVQDRVAISAPTELSGTVNINSGSTLYLSGNSTIRSIAAVTGGGQLINTADRMIVENGAYIGVPLVNHGELEIGYPELVGSVSLTAFQQGAGGSLQIDLAGSLRGGGYDRVNVLGNAQLDGALHVELINGFVPTIGSSFDILDWGGLSGAFSSLELPQIFGRGWDTSLLYVTGQLTLIDVPTLPGDYNRDGMVNAADYIVWRDTFGSNNNLAADNDSSGLIDAQDYESWKANYGRPSGSASATFSPVHGVPEPSALGLTLLGVGWALAIMPRQRQFVR